MLCHSRIERQHGGCAVRTRTYGAELKTVARESKGRSTVAVGVIQQNLGDGAHAEFHLFLRIDDDTLIQVGILNLVQCLRQLRSEEDGNDSGRCLVGAQAVRICCRDNRGFEQAVVALHCHQHVHQESNELQVLIGVLARCQEVHASVRTKRPVAVLTTTVHAAEGFLVQ